MKSSIVFGSLILILALSACGGASGGGTTSAAPAGLNENYTDALPVVEQLALGSLRLEETEQAVDESQAATLLPLWQAYQALSASDKAAEAEIAAVVKQLQQAMTSEQIAAIAAMQLTAEDLTASTEELGGLLGRGGWRQGDGEAEGGFAPVPGGGFAGGMPGGGPGGGLGGGMPGTGQGQLDPSALATRVAAAEGSGDGDSMGTFRNRTLINALIRTLQIKTGAEVPVPEEAGRFNQAFWDAISGATGIPAETLQAATADGATLAEVITADGGDLEAVEDALRQAYAGSGASEEELEAWIENLLQSQLQFNRPPAPEGGSDEPQE